MPITKKPVVHKFGIISHTQRLELQERLLKKSYLDTFKEQPAVVNRNPVEITDQFVSQYNNAKTSEEQEKLDSMARKILEKIKRKAGLKDGCEGNHVDLPFAWTDLALLAQCKGRIQEDCLDVFVKSLEQSPISTARQHIAVLLYLAETSLYWLRTDAIKQAYLRPVEIKLLKMGELVFLQLFYYHMAGHLETYRDAKIRLHTYLNGLSECQEVYSPYPNALFSLRYMNEVGKIIISDVVTASVETPGEKRENTQAETTEETQQQEQATVAMDNTSAQQNEAMETVAKQPTFTMDTTAWQQEEKEDLHYSARADEMQETLSWSVHDLSPTLWHALDIWRCTRNSSHGLQEALLAVGVCGRNINKENWIDCVLALRILGDAARVDMSVLRTVQNLAQGVSPKPKPKPKPEPDPGDVTASEKSSYLDSAVTASTPLTLSDIQEKSEATYITSDFDSVASNSTRPENPISHRSKTVQDVPSSLSSDKDQSENDSESRDKSNHQSEAGIIATDNRVNQSEDLYGADQSVRSERDQSETRREKQSAVVDQSGACDVAIGLESEMVAPSDGGFVSDHMCAAAWAELTSNRTESPSSDHTFTNMVPDLPGIHGWHWEVAVTYSYLLTDIVLHGSTSQLQKRALIGSNQEIPTRHQWGTLMKSCGLVDLVYYRAAAETSDSGPNDWSWRVRYSAIQCLVKICRLLDGNTARDGTLIAAWDVLSKVRTLENDARVLEALRVGQVEIPGNELPGSGRTLASRIAVRLASVYLPPLPAPVVAPSTPRRQTPRSCQLQPPTYKRQTKPSHDTIRGDMSLGAVSEKKIPDYKSRTAFDLRRVVEDQWDKQLQQEQLEEEKRRQKELEIEEKKNAEEHKRKMELKAEKLARNKPLIKR